MRVLSAALGLLALGPCTLAQADISDKPGFSVKGAVIVWAANDAGTAPVVLDFVIDTAPGANDTDLIDADVNTVLTGTLLPTFDSTDLDEPGGRSFRVRSSPGGSGSMDSNGNGVTDAGDVYSAFQLSDGTNLGLDDSVSRTSFYVASNTAFNIDAEAKRVVGRDDWVLGKIYWDMSVLCQGDDGLAFGSAAQYPHSGGPRGGISTVDDLLEMKTRQTVFSGNQATARDRGTLAEQSVRFDVVYTLGGWSGYHLGVGGPDGGMYEVEAEVIYTVWVP